MMVNIVELSSPNDSKITNVCLYTGLAEVTRVCNAILKEGDNKIILSGLPNVLIHESLRVEGHGPCTIHEVSICETPPRASASSSDRLKELLRQKERTEKALYRCRKCIGSIDVYQSSLTVEHVEAKNLKSVHHGIGSLSEELDNKLLDLEKQLAVVIKEIDEERRVLGNVKEDDSSLRTRVSITISADRGCEAELVLTYGVHHATWDATYDIFVKMETQDKPISLVYKGAITQSTGETWEDVSLTLETVSPTFGVSLPDLAPWTLSVYKPPTNYRSTIKYKSRGGFGLASSERRKESGMEDMLSFDEDEEGGMEPTMKKMLQRRLRVSSKGDINATFSVPGFITIPSDGVSHNVTISELGLDAVMSWVSVPKKEPKAHLTAKIRNDSEYTLLKGLASIYVDGSFISRSAVPAVSPQESFDCPLGIDPTLRVVYHPRSKRVNRTGFTRKTCSYLFEQRITLSSTKPLPISGLKIHEQIPVSEDASITVNLTNPPLLLPSVNKRGEVQPAGSVQVGGQATAQWEGVGDEDMDPSLVGKDGKLDWVCSIPAQGKLSLLLTWEVVCPYEADIMGLDI